MHNTGVIDLFLENINTFGTSCKGLQQANRERKAFEKKEHDVRMRGLDTLEKKKDQKTGILNTAPTIGGGVVDPNASVQDMGEQEAPAETNNNRVNGVPSLGLIEGKNKTPGPLTETVDEPQQAKSNPSMTNPKKKQISSVQHAQNLASLVEARAKAEKKKGFFEKVYDGVDKALTKGGKAAKEAVAETAATLQSQGKDSIKFGSYVSPEKREMYNTMIGYTKNAARKGLLSGAKPYGYAALGLTPVTASGGMLAGALKGISDMNKK